MTYVRADHVSGRLFCPMLPSGGHLSELHECVSMAFVATRPSSTGDARLFCSMRVGPGSMPQGSFWSLNDQGSNQLWFKASFSLGYILSRFCCLPGEAPGQYQYCGCCKRELCLEDLVLNAAANGGVVQVFPLKGQLPLNNEAKGYLFEPQICLESTTFIHWCGIKGDFITKCILRSLVFYPVSSYVDLK